mmetsp:Transcript_1260/g.1837  ORF Transcript_1260/g.1837 Transcript_1260/m.1837 type:complete len:1225 (-) Transcript_1260:229-3903(-)
MACCGGTRASSSGSSNKGSFEENRHSFNTTKTTARQVYENNTLTGSTERRRNLLEYDSRDKSQNLWWKRNVPKSCRLIEVLPGILTFPPKSLRRLFRFLELQGPENTFQLGGRKGRLQADTLFHTTVQLLFRTGVAVNLAREENIEHVVVFDAGFQDKVPDCYRQRPGLSSRNSQSEDQVPDQTSAQPSSAEEMNVGPGSERSEGLNFPPFESEDVFGMNGVHTLNGTYSQNRVNVTVQAIAEQAHQILFYLERYVSEGGCPTTSSEALSTQDARHNKSTRGQDICEPKNKMNFKALVIASSMEHQILLFTTLSMLLGINSDRNQTNLKLIMIDSLLRLSEIFDPPMFRSSVSSVFSLLWKGASKTALSDNATPKTKKPDMKTKNLTTESYISKAVQKLDYGTTWQSPISLDIALAVSELVLPQINLLQARLAEYFQSESTFPHGVFKSIADRTEGSVLDWRWMVLRNVVLSHVPRMKKVKGTEGAYTCRPYLMVMDGDGLNVIYSSLVKGIKEVTYIPGEPLVFDVNCLVKGDVCLKLYHLPEGSAGILLFQTHIHTATVEPDESIMRVVNLGVNPSRNETGESSLEEGGLLPNRSTVGEQLVMARKKPYIRPSNPKVKHTKDFLSCPNPQTTTTMRSFLNGNRSGNEFARRPRNRRTMKVELSNGADQSHFNVDFEVQMVFGMPESGRQLSRTGPVILSSQVGQRELCVLAPAMNMGKGESVPVKRVSQSYTRKPRTVVVRPLQGVSRLPPIQLKCPSLACGKINYISKYLTEAGQGGTSDEVQFESITCPECCHVSKIPIFLGNYIEEVMEEIECRNELSGSDTEEEDADSLMDYERPSCCNAYFSEEEGYEAKLPINDATTDRDANMNVCVQERLDVLCEMFHRLPRQDVEEMLYNALENCNIENAAEVDDQVNCLVADVLIPRNQLESAKRISTPYGKATVVQWKHKSNQVVATLEWGATITTSIDSIELELDHSNATFASELQRDASRDEQSNREKNAGLDEDVARSFLMEPVSMNLLSDNASSVFENDGANSESQNDSQSYAAVARMSLNESQESTLDAALDAQAFLDRIRNYERDESAVFAPRSFNHLRRLHTLGNRYSPYLHASQAQELGNISAASDAISANVIRSAWNTYSFLGSGASQINIEMLPVHIFEEKSGKADYNEATANKCMICQYRYVHGDCLRTLPCIHSYHISCIDPWLRRNKSCPVCQQTIDDS